MKRLTVLPLIFLSQLVFSAQPNDDFILGGYGIEEVTQNGTSINQFGATTKALINGDQGTVCKGSSIPAGWIILEETTLGGCYTITPDAWVIRKPTLSEYSVCKISPVPEGWAAVAITSGRCPGPTPNMYVIRKLGVQETICKSSTIPSGYRIIGEAWANCPGSQPSGWMITRG